MIRVNIKDKEDINRALKRFPKDLINLLRVFESSVHLRKSGGAWGNR